MNKKWVIPDIHGCYETFVQLIEEKINPTRQDEIYLLGDYIDRGPNSKGVIDYIIQLQEKGYRVFPLKGNHEDVFLRCYAHEKNAGGLIGLFELKESWLYFGGKATLRSFHVSNLIDVPEAYMDYLENLPFYQILDDYILVHAGLNFSIQDPFSDQLSMLWIKDFQVDYKKTGGRKVIHGHVPFTLDEIKQGIDESRSFSLDNGCVYHTRKGMGNLIALELNSQSLAIQPNLDSVKRNRLSVRMVA